MIRTIRWAIAMALSIAPACSSDVVVETDQSGAASSGPSSGTGASGGADSVTVGPGTGGNGTVCSADAFKGVGGVEDEWGPGTYCDELYACLDRAAQEELAASFPELACEISMTCPSDALRCSLQPPGVVLDAFVTLCEALRDGVLDEVTCAVYL